MTEPTKQTLAVTRRQRIEAREPINLRDLYSEITRLEGGKVNLSVAQVSEVGKLLIGALRERFAEDPAAVVDLLQRSE